LGAKEEEDKLKIATQALEAACKQLQDASVQQKVTA
jgi:hypothetical protein